MLATVDREIIDGEIGKLGRRFFRTLNFTKALEERFEQDTAKDRSYRLWLEGIIAIIVLNGCLLVDYILVDDARWQSIVLRTMFVTPLALLINVLMRFNPKSWIREGSVAGGTAIICFINLCVEGNETAATTTYGLICVLITVLFADVVMRLRLWYAATATAVMSAGGLWFLVNSTGLRTPEKIVAASLMAIGIAITMVASYSLEREERLGYLLYLRSDLQGQELTALNAQLQHLSTIDTLTGLPNRRAFDKRLVELWVAGERSKTPLSAILLDVDNFKVLNDRRGHLYGDEVLHRIAGLLNQGLPDHGHFAARFGGEEFVVLLPNTDLEEALVIAERIRNLIEVSGPSEMGSGLIESGMWATVSGGISACVPGEEMHPDDLLKGADRALYDAKASGRNRVTCQVVEPRRGSSPAE